MMEALIAGIAALAGLAAALFAWLAWRRAGAATHAAAGERFDRLDAANERLERELRGEVKEAALAGRLELAHNVGQFQQSLGQQMASIATVQNAQIDGFAQQLAKLTEANELRLAALQKAVDERMGAFAQDARAGREENAAALRRFGDGLNQELAARLAEVRATLEARLKDIETQNAAKLDEMRRTVDEKLHATLEQRLGESFKQVSDRLEAVHKGLGEMHNLAVGVGDLKRVLTNVKTRGTWGEVQLGALLEQLLTAEQYATNVATVPGSGERVEFAIRLPGREGEAQVWLPIDSKFPVEDYERIVAAQEAADPAALEEAARALEARIKVEGRTIRDKYVAPPHTTDFGILFLPTEGLYAEVLRRPGLADWLQRTCRVSVAGPTTLTALLNALQMGFRTLAIEKRSSEVWQVLGAVKTEFGKFGEVLARTKSQLETVTRSIDQAETRTRQMERKLKGVEALPEPAALRLIDGAPDAD
ncbi:MAG: DNA recombination protein RmuC [Burkholderiales bacterium]|nr:DNA recombination protein RmuC [Burkholderiales bacterium]